MRSIETLECSDNFRQLNFEPSSYKNSQNKEMPEYIITRDGFTFLVMGFTGREAAKFKEEFIRAFVQMEQQLKHQPTSQAEMLLQSVQLLVEQEKRISGVEQEVKELKAKSVTRPDYFTIAGYGSLHGIEVNLKMAGSLGRRATKLCKERGIEPDKMPDPRFGMVNCYPRHVLDEVFKQPINT